MTNFRHFQRVVVQFHVDFLPDFHLMQLLSMRDILALFNNKIRLQFN